MAEEKGYCKFKIPGFETEPHDSCLSSDRFCNIIENTIDAIITFNVEGVITGWNSGAEWIYQYTAEEVLGKSYYPIIPKERWGEFVEIIDNIKKHKRIPDYETQRLRKDGKLLDVSISFFALKDKVGRVNEFCAIHRDITERKKMQDEIFRAKQLAAIGQLAAGVAHALNTPLASILMSTQMLKDDTMTESSTDDLNRIERQTERCRNIVRNLLNLSRPAGTLREPTDFNNVIKTVVNAVEPTLKSRSIRCEINLDKTVPPIQCDPHAVEELISNLVTNAADAINTSGLIKINTQTKEESVVIIIEDNGRGIRQEDLPHIFDPFFTTKEIGKGTGLGLALCARIVNNHNGQIEVESQKGAGAKFTITFPREKATAEVLMTV